MKNNSWSIFDSWNYKIEEKILSPDWHVFDGIVSTLSSFYKKKYKEFQSLYSKWDKKLKLYGGEPSNFNWDHFRPLRLTREEDWSDWLIHLISESQTGYFSSHLFCIKNIAQNDYSRPGYVSREVSCMGRRADIIIKWNNGIYSHVEIKIGDENLTKTYDTAEVMRSYYKVPKNKWHDFIIILESQVEDWVNIENREKYPIQYLIWNDVAIALRKSILISNEPLSWKVWAYSFLGATEQKLLNFKYGYEISDVSQIENNILILKEGLLNE